MIERGRDPGERRDHYAMPPGLWYEAVSRRDAVLVTWIKAMEEGISVVGCGPPPVAGSSKRRSTRVPPRGGADPAEALARAASSPGAVDLSRTSSRSVSRPRMRPTWPGARRIASGPPRRTARVCRPRRGGSRVARRASQTHFRGDDEARQSHRCTCVPAMSRRAPLADRWCLRLERRGPAWTRRRVARQARARCRLAHRLPRRGVVDDLALRQVRGDKQRCCLRHCRGQREVAGGDHADACRMRGSVDLVVRPSAEPRCPDHHMDTTLDRRQRVTFGGLMGRELDEHVDPVEGCRNVARHDDSARLDAPGSAEILTCGRACHRARSSRSGAAITASATARPVQPVAPATHSRSA